MLKKLNEKWGISTPFQMVIVFIVFGVTGSVAAKISGPIISILPIEDLPAIIYWPLRLLIIFPVYQVLLVLFGFIFGAIVSVFTFKKDKFIFNFFFNLSLKMSKKMINWLSFGILFKN
jgi:hypothetical protein|tara:strand:+ start:67 stop:420 length:354 start_codon:yes stop_codon:yes gene_type:complete